MESGVGAGGLTLSDMGTMNNGGGPGGAGFERGESNAPDGDSGESAAAPPKPLIMEHVWHLIHVFTRSPSIGQRRFASGCPASNTAIFSPWFSFVSS